MAIYFDFPFSKIVCGTLPHIKKRFMGVFDSVLRDYVSSTNYILLYDSSCCNEVPMQRP